MNIFKKKRFLSVIIIILVVLLIAANIIVQNKARELGSELGRRDGERAGLATGSWRGVTEGIKSGIEAGKETGLSAEDTEAVILEMMQEIERLEVLCAEVKLKNLHEIGTAYKVLYIAKGNAIFTIDLSQATAAVDMERKIAEITIPRPELDLYLNQAGTEKLAEAQNFSLTTSARDGIEAYLNSLVQIEKNVRDTMENYDSLMESAEEAAQQQINMLASTVCGPEWKVSVEFRRKNRGATGANG